jgi:UDP-glucose 4-epimerase
LATLVIGGSGFIGSVVVKVLSDDNIETICYDLVHTNSVAAKNNWIRADILELQSIERIFFEYNIDSIVHLVGLPAIDYCERNPHFSFLLNVMSVQNALEAMRMADIPKIVFASSATVYGSHYDKPLKESDQTNPGTLYGHHKLIAEEAIKSYQETYGIKSVILRLFNVYGGSPKIGKDVISLFMTRAIRGEPLIVRGPDKFRDFVHINDVAKAFAQAVASNNANNLILNIGTGSKTTLKEVASMVNQHFPFTKVVEEACPDNATGLYADMEVTMKVLALNLRQPEAGINDHVRKFCNSKTIGIKQ